MESNCILYRGAISNSGYGLDYDPETQKTIGAHRLAFKQAYRYLPKVVMHVCDNPLCVNPAHLKGGTQSENILDCVTKGRFDYSRRKLTEVDAMKIYSSALTQRELAAKFNVDQKTIHNIKSGKLYKRITNHSLNKEQA